MRIEIHDAEGNLIYTTVSRTERGFNIEQKKYIEMAKLVRDNNMTIVKPQLGGFYRIENLTDHSLVNLSQYSNPEKALKAAVATLKKVTQQPVGEEERLTSVIDKLAPNVTE